MSCTTWEIFFDSDKKKKAGDIFCLNDDVQFASICISHVLDTPEPTIALRAQQVFQLS